MLSSRLRFALRSLWRSKTYSALNIAGLAIALAVSIIVLLYLKSELSYDEHYPDHERIYRVHTDFYLNDQQQQVPLSSLALMPMMARDYDYIEGYTRLDHIQANILFKSAQLNGYENNIAIADSNFFEVFQVEMLEGNPRSALSEPLSIVLTESFKERYFGSDPALGKSIRTNNFEYQVSGVIPDVPANSHHRYDAVISFFNEPLSAEEEKRVLWNTTLYSFVKLPNNVGPERMERDFEDFYDRYMREYGEKFGSEYDIKLQRMDRIHYAEPLTYDRTSGNRTYLYAFGGIGALILVLACINYINMATARGMRRGQEAGIRRILGSSRRGIRALIFTESVVLAFLSLFLAFVMVELTLELSPLNRILENNLSLDFERYPELWWYPVSLALVVGIISGWYPAVTLSRVTPLSAVQGHFRFGKQSIVVRKVLVGFQFCVSVAVVITALLMYHQMEYIRQKDLGYNKEDVLLVPIRDSVSIKKLPLIRERLGTTEHIISTGLATNVPGTNLNKTLMNVQTESDTVFEKRLVDNISVGIHYLETMGIELTQGRNFNSDDTISENSGLLVNQSFVDAMQWQSPIGKEVRWGFTDDGAQLYKGRIVGVVKDFNMQSLHQKVSPTLIFLQKEQSGIMHIRVDSEYLLSAIDNIEGVFADVDRESPFQFSFLDRDLMLLYEEEHRQSRLILYLTYLAIFISFLGLTGLASFATNLRTREIGLRKVLGADVYQMVNLIFKDMLILVVIAVLLAIPLAYLLFQGWLSNFAYAARLNPFIFLGSALIAVLLAYLIVSYHSIRVARSNPIETLKHE